MPRASGHIELTVRGPHVYIEYMRKKQESTRRTHSTGGTASGRARGQIVTRAPRRWADSVRRYGGLMGMGR